MARPRTPQSLKQRLFANNVIKPVIYCEGPHEYSYLSKLVELHVIKDYQQGIKLQATAIKLRINAIKRDLNNESIEQLENNLHETKKWNLFNLVDAYADNKNNDLELLKVTTIIVFIYFQEAYFRLGEYSENIVFNKFFLVNKI